MKELRQNSAPGRRKRCRASRTARCENQMTESLPGEPARAGLPALRAVAAVPYAASKARSVQGERANDARTPAEFSTTTKNDTGTSTWTTRQCKGVCKDMIHNVFKFHDVIRFYTPKVFFLHNRVFYDGTHAPSGSLSQHAHMELGSMDGLTSVHSIICLFSHGGAGRHTYQLVQLYLKLNTHYA